MRYKILVVDDNLTIIKLISQILELAGYEVITHTKSLGIAVVILRERPHLILLDVEMPYFNGIEVCKFIKQHPSMVNVANIPILFYSQKSEEELLQITKQAGAQGYIMKSWSSSTIYEKIDNHIK